MTFRRLRRDAFVVVICAVIAVAASNIYGSSIEPLYRSEARMLVTPNNQNIDGRDLLNALDTLARTSVMPTYVEVLNSARIRQSAAASLGFPAGSLSAYEVSVVALPEANILEVTTEGTDPDRVAQLTNALVDVGAEYLSSRYITYEIEVLDGAVAASEPFAPNPVRDGILAAVLGIGLGTAVVLGVAGLQAAFHVVPSPASSKRERKTVGIRR